jgi:hypothetical protein
MKTLDLTGWSVCRHKKGVTFMPPPPFCVFCADCHTNVGYKGEWYMLKARVWEKAWPRTAQKSVYDKLPLKHNLCIGCVEQRLGRRLTRRDFDLRIRHNRPDRHDKKKGRLIISRRFRNRLWSEQ